MKLGLALGAAVIATTVVAYASTEGGRRHFVFHRGEQVSADTNGDGWLSRDEAAAQADRLFADLDRDNNGLITDRDHELLREEVEAEVERAMEGVRIEMQNLDLELEGLDEEIEAEVEAEMAHAHARENCTTTTENEGNTRRVTVVCEDEDGDVEERAARAAERAERRVQRNVRVIRGGPGDRVIITPPVPPVPPVPRIPGPMFFSMGGDDEADLNGDGALSREEFRAQQLRYFDARDANGDGRVRYEEPPEPPEAPEPPAPPHHD